MGKGNWEDNFNELVKVTLPMTGNKEWRFVLEESKNKGTMQINARLWQLPKEDDPDGYSGPTKNGFIQQIKTPKDVDNLQDSLNEFFGKVKEML